VCLEKSSPFSDTKITEESEVILSYELLLFETKRVNLRLFHFHFRHSQTLKKSYSVTSGGSFCINKDRGIRRLQVTLGDLGDAGYSRRLHGSA